MGRQKATKPPAHYRKVELKQKFHSKPSNNATQKVESRLCIPRKKFEDLVKEILHIVSKGSVTRIERDAVDAFHQSAEEYLIRNFKMGEVIKGASNDRTLMPKHMAAARRINNLDKN
uniref:Histone domain-containing protein n=1 Tax=Strongyloides papillosus TaxID=174720 RepID=A0A0N5B4A0_STREA